MHTPRHNRTSYRPTPYRRYSAGRLGAIVMAGALHLSLAQGQSMDGVADFSWTPAMPQVSERFVLTVAGHWPDSCVPQLDDITIEQNIINVWAHRPRQACDQQATAYRLDIDPTVDNPDLAAGTYQLKLFVSNENEALGRLQAFDLIEIGADPANAVVPETGLWWPLPHANFPASGPGTGFSMELQGQALVIMANVYDSQQGRPTWLFATGLVEGRLSRANMVTLWGGQSLFGDYQAPEGAAPAARMILQFDSQATATAWLTAPSGSGHERQLLLRPLALVRWAFGRDRITAVGDWVVVVEDNGQKPSIHPFSFLPPSDDQETASVRLFDRNGNGYLQCDYGDPKAPPLACRLFSSVSSSLLFDDVGLDRMRGFTSQGARVTAFRLDP